MELAIRIADEETIFVKKSTYFSNIKQGEISSYKEFIKDNYEPGESVDYLRLKAKDRTIWGSNNITFSDSVQINADLNPKRIEVIIQKIEAGLSNSLSIKLPKLEAVKENELKNILDKKLLNNILSESIEFNIAAFTKDGFDILNDEGGKKYKIYIKGKDKNIENIDEEIEKTHISNYIKKHITSIDINNVMISIRSDQHRTIAYPLKNIIEASIRKDDDDRIYFLKNSSWYYFNETFSEYLKNSLESIKHEKEVPLIEEEYIEWSKPMKKIKTVSYREYYFNLKISEEKGYDLLDRKNHSVASIIKDGYSNYKVELADLYNKKDAEIISVKIGMENPCMVYNISQSLVAARSYKEKMLSFNQPIKRAALWFIFEKNINKITEVNKLQFLISLETWKKNIINMGLEPYIYISEHVK